MQVDRCSKDHRRENHTCSDARSFFSDFSSAGLEFGGFGSYRQCVKRNEHYCVYQHAECDRYSDGHGQQYWASSSYCG